MIITRIQVEEGFLDGLDVQFSTGLNVLIGPRGAGKTSIIELIRFCLGADALTERASLRSREHAISILGSGSVTVTCKIGTERFTVSRTADHWTKTGESDLATPLVLSQNEIESVGLSASGRLRLLDEVRDEDLSTRDGEEESLLSYIRSQTDERRTVCLELQNIRKQLDVLSEELKEATTLKKQHADALKSIEKASAETTRLNALSRTLAGFSVRSGVFTRVASALTEWRKKLQAVCDAEPEIETWPEAARSEDPLGLIRQTIGASREHLRSALQHIERGLSDLKKLSGANASDTLEQEEEARKLRRQLETLQKGAGQVARRLGQLEEKQSQRSALSALLKTKSARLEKIQQDRKRLLDSLDEIRQSRFEQRNQLASRLNGDLGPQIRISVERAGLNSQYASAIVGALRGSALRYNELGPLIANEMSPREFVEAVEKEDAGTLSQITGLSIVRAAKVIDRLNENGVEDILTAPVDDGVILSLLDGSEYKTTEDLSTGQRCTIVLPLLLRQKRSTLIVDQPEDHLDNAFIVETVIKAISKRKAHGQLIFSTHNPNIPVLGEADLVVSLASDGSRGFVKHAGLLDDPATVSAITSIMEGGLEAFERRAKFYHAKRS